LGFRLEALGSGKAGFQHPVHVLSSLWVSLPGSRVMNLKGQRLRVLRAFRVLRVTRFLQV
jgi:hypothetical protein